MKIYTKTGDGGETGLYRGPRVPKHHPRVEAYGNVDELNAILGVLLTKITHGEIRDLLSGIQHELFDVGADLATPTQELNDKQHRITEAMVQRLEQAIDHFEETLPPLHAFILPGGSKGGALLHYARAVCRRAERSATLLNQQESMNPVVLHYLNRLSDLLFVLARAENHSTGSPEIKWKARNK